MDTMPIEPIAEWLPDRVNTPVKHFDELSVMACGSLCAGVVTMAGTVAGQRTKDESPQSILFLTSQSQTLFESFIIKLLLCLSKEKDDNEEF